MATPVDATPSMMPMSPVVTVCCGQRCCTQMWIGSKRVAILGRASIGAAAEMIMKAPFRIPAPPHPATARPAMNIIEDWAAPQIKDPTMKTKKAKMKITFPPTAEVRTWSSLISEKPPMRTFEV